MKRIGMALGCAALLGFSGWSESVAKTPAKWDMEARSRAIRSAPRCPNGEGEETKNVCIREQLCRKPEVVVRTGVQAGQVDLSGKNYKTHASLDCLLSVGEYGIDVKWFV